MRGHAGVGGSRRGWTLSLLACVSVAAGAVPTLADASTVTLTQVRVLGGPGLADIYPSGVAVAPDGDILVADTGNNQVVAFNASGTQLWRVGSSGRGTGQFLQPRDVAADGQGDVFVADTGNARIVELSESNGAWVTSWTGPSSSPLLSPMGVSVADGRIYVAEAGHSAVDVFDMDGDLLQAITSNGSCILDHDRDADADANGNVYVANYAANNVLVFAPDGACSGVIGGKGKADGDFSHPYGIDVETDPYLTSTEGQPEQALYVADSNNERIQELTLTGGWVATIGSQGSQDGQFVGLRRVAVATDGSGDVWAADLWGYRVERFQHTGPGQYSYSGQVIGDQPPPLTATQAFNQVNQVAFNSSDDLDAVDTVNQRIVQMSSDGAIVGPAYGQRAYPGCFSKPGCFNWPRGIAVDPATGNLWIADTKQSDVQVLESNGTPLKRFGGAAGSGPRTFDWPESIAISATNRVAFIADTYNDRIDAWNVATERPIANFGTLGSGTGQFDQPSAVAVDSNGNVYVADTANARVVELSESDGSNMTVLRSISTPGMSDPTGVAVDQAGRIYVTDSAAQCLFVFSPAGALLTTVFDSFDSPQSVAVDSSGLVYVSDTYNDRIVVFSVAS